MIQLNLLPDVKLEYIKSNRMRRTITSLSILVTVVSVGLLIITLGVGFAQKARIKSINGDIAAKTAKLKAKPEIDKVLTVQNQLDSLTALHASKPAVSSLFTYLNQVTPTQVGINNLHIDFTAGAEKMTLTGTTDALSSVNKFVDTLKFTKYTSDTVTTATPAFKNVVLTSFGLSNASKQVAGQATYTVDMAYDRSIFNITDKVKLEVPKLTTTRSSVDAPSNVFQSAQGAQ